MINIKGELQIEIETGKIWFNSEDGVCVLRLQIPPEHIHVSTQDGKELMSELFIDLKYNKDDLHE